MNNAAATRTETRDIATLAQELGLAGRLQVERFNHRWEASPKQCGYINYLARDVGTTMEAALEALWGMPVVVAWTDRAWGRITKREASKLIDLLKAAQR